MYVVFTHTHRLAVGTDKGLIIQQDTLTNTLIQLIGSDSKLLIVSYICTNDIMGHEYNTCLLQSCLDLLW